MKFQLIAASIVAFVTATSVFAFEGAAAPTGMDPQRIQAQLDRFRANPRQVMNEVPAKRHSGRAKAKFSQADIVTRAYIEQKAKARDEKFVISPFAGDKAQIDAATDSAATLVGTLPAKTLAQMDGKLQAGAVKTQPWSDDYWAIDNGIIAYRYESSAPEGWTRYNEYMKANGFKFPNASSIDDASPAEKYDLLVGDRAFSLTRANLQVGKKYVKPDGTVEGWMGICHGWAPAAFMEKRPSRKIELLAADGKTRIPFYPSDIKALASSLWANTNTPTRFTGGRCNSKDPAQDETGRVTDQKCFDTNPGTWHLAIVNQVGLKKESFVIDATFDYEVWNQPVKGYEYTYFNPITNQVSNTLAGAKVAIKDFKNDEFKKFRSPKAVYLVGVAMDLEYIVETSPDHSATDAPDSDAIDSATYTYDLELDAAGTIIGGEWRENLHPDFLWTPAPGARATAPADRIIAQDEKVNPTRWKNPQKQGFPAAWLPAVQASSAKGIPSYRVVKTLIDFANSPI